MSRPSEADKNATMNVDDGYVDMLAWNILAACICDLKAYESCSRLPCTNAATIT